MYGGFTSSVVDGGKVKTLKKELPHSIQAVMVIPDRPMSTAHSRTLLPKNYLMKHVVYNLSHASMLSAAFFSENWDILKVASKDCMHEYRRMKQMKELFDVRDVAFGHGALMSTLSGSGSEPRRLKNWLQPFEIISKCLELRFLTSIMMVLALSKAERQINFDTIRR